MILVLDNRDSFTFNLVQAFQVLGAQVMVHRHDQLTVDEAVALDPSHLVISPGPGNPDDAGISMALIERLTGSVPVLGVCLGHQCIAQLLGATIGPAQALMHGKASLIEHDGQGLFTGLPQPMQVGRYHSLAIEPATLPAELQVSARTDDGEIMAVRAPALRLTGVQFHPESILTPDGDQLLANFLGVGLGPVQPSRVLADVEA